MPTSAASQTLDQLGPALDTWRAPRRVPAQSQPTIDTIPLEQAREEIRKRVHEHLSADKPGLLIISGVPGVGKTQVTSEVAEQVAQATGIHIAWFGTRHDQFDTVPRPAGCRHMMGRNADNCRKSEDASIIGQKGWRVTRELCSRCPHRKGCSWWGQWEGDAHRYLVSQHLRAANLWDRPGLRLVLDEPDIQQLASEPVPFDSHTIERWRSEWSDRSGIFSALMAFLKSHAGDGYLADSPLYDELIHTLPDGLPGTLKLSNWRRPEDLPDGRVNELLNALYEERERYLRAERFVSRLAVNDETLLYYPPLDLPDRVFKHPAVLLNSTVEVEHLRFLLQKANYPVDHFSPSVALNSGTTVKYVLDANHSKTAIAHNGPAYCRDWEKRLRDAVADSEQALVVATKNGEKMLTKLLQDLIADGRVVPGHYGALSGLNAYETCDTVVLSQPFNPSPAAVAGIYRRVYGGREGAPLDLDICFRSVVIPWTDHKEKTWEVDVSSMRDERLAPIYEWWRWSEMYQAAHRVRPLLHERKVVITCAVFLQGLPPTEVVYNSRKRKMLDRLRDAAMNLLEYQGYVTQKDLADEAGVHKSTANRHWDALIQAESLHVEKEHVPTPGYPGGRLTRTARRR